MKQTRSLSEFSCLSEYTRLYHYPHYSPDFRPRNLFLFPRFNKMLYVQNVSFSYEWGPSYFSTKTYVVDAQNYHLDKAGLFSTPGMG